MDDEDGKVVPIRPVMEPIFLTEFPPVEPQLREMLDCRRYDLGLCRSCDKPRGRETPWCRFHYPWNKRDWRKL